MPTDPADTPEFNRIDALQREVHNLQDDITDLRAEHAAKDALIAAVRDWFDKAAGPASPRTPRSIYSPGFVELANILGVGDTEMATSASVAWRPLQSPAELTARLAGCGQILADRERELLQLKGPCSNKECPLHYAHSGPCAPPKDDADAH